jgi:hypothetical protein
VNSSKPADYAEYSVTNPGLVAKVEAASKAFVGNFTVYFSMHQILN